MKKYIILLLLVLFCSSTLCVQASEGNLEIILSDEQEIELYYVKIAEWQNGEFVIDEIYQDSNVDLNDLKTNTDVREAIQKLIPYMSIKNDVVDTIKGSAEIKSLETGVYYVGGMSDEQHKVQDTLVSIPMWNEEAGEMSYAVQISPKISTVSVAPETGDDMPMLFWAGICMIFLLIIVRTLFFPLKLC